MDKANQEYNTVDVLNEPIAIVGMNCQFPGVDADIEDVNAFYKMLLKEQTPIKEVPENRWDINQYYDADRQKEDKIVSRVGGFLENPQVFDATFFKILPVEAKQIDPQHRLFLEVSIRALNHANITLDSLKNSNTGVYCGISTHDYSQLNYKDKIKFNAYTYIGSADSAAAGRLSYFLNLKGPCITVDTACSSSLSALYVATTALRNQQCDMAIVGGVHLSLCPEIFIGVTKANMLSALGQCSSFDAKADGYARSEGCGVVVVKRLSDALKDNNKIHAVLKSVVMNQDGGGMGMAAPNVEAQIALHQSVLEQAHLAAGDIDYIETHGTGTVVGDSVEFNAIQHIHQGHHPKDKPLIIGAVKNNLGHTISSSGMASLIKVIEVFKNETIPANLHYSTPNSSIDPESIPALIPVKATAFTKQRNKKRYAQVSNFGFTGTNVSAIIEEPPSIAVQETIADNDEPACFVISANSEYSLQRMLINQQHYLKQTSISLHDVCYTLINCRDHYKFRCAIIAKNKEELINKIESKDYTLKKVAIEKDIRITGTDAQQIYEFYLSGANIRSDKNKVRYNQVDLPLYVFDRKTYWHDKEKSGEMPVPEDWCFKLESQYQPIDISNYNKTGNQWLLIGAKQLAPGLIQQGLPVVQEETDYTLNDLDGIIFAEGFDSPLPEDIDARITLQKNILRKLLALVKELNQKTIKLRLIVLAAQATAAHQLDSSPLYGFCKTLVLELPQYKTTLIDLDNTEVGNCSIRIMNEINYNHGKHYEHVIAYREDKRMVFRLKNTRLQGQKQSLNREGRYLITGGCGGLGLVTAEALLSAGAKELILVSRATDKPFIKASLKKIQSLYPERVIRPVSLDITNKNDLHQLLLESNADGLLRGIVHAAGSSINAPLLEHQNKDIDYLFSAKVQGGWYLHDLSRNLDLDFFVVYSSISSVFGSNKESVYSATNSFLDALIAERQRLGLVGTAIQWGPWAEVGMAEKRSRDQGLKQAMIHNEQGQAFIQRLINGQSTHTTIIAPEYLKFMLDFVPKPLPAFYKCLADELNMVEEPSSPAELSPWLSEYIKIDDDKKFTACKEMLSVTCKEILGIPKTDELDEFEGFFEIGLDSLMMTELATRLKEKLAPILNVLATIAFDYPSINKLSAYIESELKNHLINPQTLPLSFEATDDSIAIIGMSCSFPNAPDVAAYEILLENGLSGIKDIPIERWDNSTYYDLDPDAPGKSYVTKLGLIDDIKYFDPTFFGISPREAPLMEPQQRLFLEHCYKALEHANYPPRSLQGSLTGVYAGVGSSHEYYSQLEKAGLSNDELGMFAVTGKALNIIPGRVAFTFDFKGPALSIDTACSSSLVAIHYACQSLKNREIDFALAGGVNVLLRPESIVNLCKAKALSPESQCKTFDESADGYVRAEGCGVLFLKRIADALRDKDTILAVIKGSAVNNDGKSAGLTVPNGKSQEDVMMAALSQTELTNNDIGYIEAHGTGTPLGDPIEIHSINKVYGHQRSQDNPLYVGAVKTNIGHLESASGVASMIKVIIGLQKKRIYKNLNFHRLNPKIKLDDTQIALDNRDWNTNTKLKCAGVNAFGFSGTNAHAILQEFPQTTMQRETLPSKSNVLVLSAKTPRSLDKLRKRYQQFLETTSYNFNDLCFTAATCRDHYAYRLAVAARSASEASHLIERGEYASSHGKNNILDFQDDKELNLLVSDYLQGKNVDWVAYYKTNRYKLIKVDLPNYTFDRSEFWLDKKDLNIVSLNPMHPLLGRVLSMPGNEYVFNNQLNFSKLNYINQHRIFDKLIAPTALCIESGLAAAQVVLKGQSFCLEQFIIERPLYPTQGMDFQVQVKPKDAQRYIISIYAKQNDNWQKYADMEILSTSLASASVDINVLKSSMSNPVDLAHFYEDLKKKPICYGAEFQVLQEAYVTSNSVLSKVVLAKTNNEQGYCYHPVVLESAIQSLFLINKDDKGNTTHVPYAFARMTVFQNAPRTVWIHLMTHEPKNENEWCVEVRFYDGSGLLIGRIEELQLRQVTQSHFCSYESVLEHIYDIKWDALDANLLNPTKIPVLYVISKNEVKTKKIFGHLNYQLVDDVHKLDRVEHKNIVFLYEQGQFNDLFHCCQQMFQSPPASFILVTENAYALEHSLNKVNPYHTMASAFWKSFRNELDLNKNYTIDLNSNSTLGATLEHVFNPENEEIQFAVRDRIYLPRLKKKQLPSHPASQDALFDREASYLITGGTGGLAKPLIEYLIHRGVKHIIITSRSECPLETQALIDQARKKQIYIKHNVADASNFQQMEDIVKNIEQSANPLKGVFHLAGVIRDELIVNLSDEAVQEVLSAKIEGALTLHELTQYLQLDFFVLFSSSASILGSKGQSNYVAANGFLDGLAHLRQQKRLPALAINWGAFHSIGMAAKTINSIQRRGFIPLDKESIDVLDVLLPSQLPQILVCPIHWNIYFKNMPKPIVFSERVKDTPAPQYHFLAFLRQHTGKERVAILSRTLSDITADVLRLDNREQVGIKNDLFAMGMDSLMSLELRNRIHDKLQCPTLSLPIEYFINEPRIDKIARNIANELQHVFEHEPDYPSDQALTGEETPLCDTQYIFWMIQKMTSSFNCAMQLQLHGQLNKELLSEAIEFAINQNSVFWLNISEDVPVQMLKKQGKFKLIYEDISLNYNRDILNEVFNDNVMQMIPFTVQPLIRMYLYKLKNELHELHIMIPHIILDDSSYRILFDQFKQNYETLLLGKKLVPVPEQYSYLDYVKHNNALYEKDLNNKIDFWNVYNKDFQRLSFGSVYHLPDAANQPQNLFHYPMEAQLIERFKEWHHEKNINLSTGVIAVCQIVFYKISLQNKIPITILHTGREGSRYKSVVGLFTEYKRINITLDKEYTFIDFLKSIEEELTKTAPYQKCSQLIKNAGLKDSRLTMGQYLTYIYNKLVLAKRFKKSKLNPIATDYYLRHLSLLSWRKTKINIKYRLNQLFQLNLPMLKPDRLRVLINITASFFIKEPRDLNFAGLETSIPNHYGSVDRPIGNQTLWLYFTKDQFNEYRLSINGPLTGVCKDLIAQELNHVMAKVLENNEFKISDLLRY